MSINIQDPERFDEFTGPMDAPTDSLIDEIHQTEAAIRRLCEKLAAKWGVPGVTLTNFTHGEYGVRVWSKVEPDHRLVAMESARTLAEAVSMCNHSMEANK